MDREKRNVFKAFTLILQLGINVMVPTALCVAVGIFIDKRFNTSYWTVILMFLGMMAGGRNAYRLAMSVASDDKDKMYKDKSQNGKGDGNA